jgi:hypothetical protein
MLTRELSRARVLADAATARAGSLAAAAAQEAEYPPQQPYHQRQQEQQRQQDQQHAHHQTSSFYRQGQPREQQPAFAQESTLHEGQPPWRPSRPHGPADGTQRATRPSAGEGEGGVGRGSRPPPRFGARLGDVAALEVGAGGTAALRPPTCSHAGPCLCCHASTCERL